MDQVCPFPFWLNYIYNMYPLQVGYGWDWRQKGTELPLLLTTDIKEAMEILLKKRWGQHQSKQQVFLYPPVWTSTCHRKYVVTVSPLLDLQEKELDLLAQHMGHDIRVHREYFRLNESGAGKNRQNIGTSWWGKHPSSHWEIFEWSRVWCWLVKHPCLVLVDHNLFKFCT